jgi:G3E family GTPase
VLQFSDTPHPIKPGATITATADLWQLQLRKSLMVFTISITQTGAYALFTEHRPEEFKAELRRTGRVIDAVHTHEFKPDHEHDEAVKSVGITLPGDLDAKKFNAWLSELLMTKGPDIFRMKGVLSVQGSPNRFVFQGVHMLFDGQPDRPWGDEARHNALIFIGRNLDRAELNQGFRACLA